MEMDYWGCNSSFPSTSCASLNKLLNLSVLYNPHLQNANDNKRLFYSHYQFHMINFIRML